MNFSKVFILENRYGVIFRILLYFPDMMVYYFMQIDEIEAVLRYLNILFGNNGSIYF